LAAIPGNERTEALLRGVLLGGICEHKEGSFMVSVLPGGQKAIGQ
jgi:hypothetical protein